MKDSQKSTKDATAADVEAIVMRRCDECGENNQAIVEHFDEHWCLDCMRQAGYCISCDAYLPAKVDDYWNYKFDQCPDCVYEIDAGMFEEEQEPEFT